MYVVTAGTFDMLHKGHLNLLQRCRSLAGPNGHVHVLVNGDTFVTEFKGREPVQDESTRLKVVEALRMVDTAEVGRSRKSLRNLLGELQALVVADNLLLVVGSDWLSKEYYKQVDMSPEEAEKILVYVPYTQGVSSTEIRERL